MSVFSRKLIALNETRVDPGEVIGYEHVYQAPSERQSEVSHVVVYLKGGCQATITPTKALHSEDILRKLDKHFGLKPV